MLSYWIQCQKSGREKEKTHGWAKNSDTLYQTWTWLWQTLGLQLHYSWGLMNEINLFQRDSVNILKFHGPKRCSTSSIIQVSKSIYQALLSWGFLLSLGLTPKMLISKGCLGEGLRYWGILLLCVCCAPVFMLHTWKAGNCQSQKQNRWGVEACALCNSPRL